MNFNGMIIAVSTVVGTWIDAISIQYCQCAIPHEEYYACLACGPFQYLSLKLDRIDNDDIYPIYRPVPRESNQELEGLHG